MKNITMITGGSKGVDKELGKSKVLVLGESPAKDGWIVSGKSFYNKDGKLQASISRFR